MGDQNITSWIRWHTTILPYISHNCREESPWTGELSRFFWEENRDEIMSIYLEGMKHKNQPFQRPHQYFAEIEATYPRKKNETNKQYLKRFNLLADWEVDK